MFSFIGSVASGVASGVAGVASAAASGVAGALETVRNSTVADLAEQILTADATLPLPRDEAGRAGRKQEAIAYAAAALAEAVATEQVHADDVMFVLSMSSSPRAVIYVYSEVTAADGHVLPAVTPYWLLRTGSGAVPQLPSAVLVSPPPPPPKLGPAVLQPLTEVQKEYFGVRVDASAGGDRLADARPLVRMNAPHMRSRKLELMCLPNGRAVFLDALGPPPKIIAALTHGYLELDALPTLDDVLPALTAADGASGKTSGSRRGTGLTLHSAIVYGVDTAHGTPVQEALNVEALVASTNDDGLPVLPPPAPPK